MNKHIIIGGRGKWAALFVAAAALLCTGPGVRAQPAGPPVPVFMADGVKIGEVGPDTAIVWSRLTLHAERKADGFPFKRFVDPVPEAEQLNGHALEEMEGAVPGTPGEMRVVYWRDGLAAETTRVTGWTPVGAATDCAAQFPLAGLEPATRYRMRVEGRAQGSERADCVTPGTFATAPRPDVPARVNFVVVTCQDYPRRDDPVNGHQIYRVMRERAPDFLVHTGDIEYYDKPTPLATNARLARFKWNRIYSLPFQRAFHAEVPAYFMKDDHDTLKDDAWPGQTYGDLTWKQGLAIFREQVPMGEKTYRRVRWGQDLELWLVEGRDFRSPNDRPDGPDKTIWGAEQKRWFFETVRNSRATFRILISPTPVVGPDRENKSDNYANRSFAHEGREIREFIATQKNMFVICGDRHWQYASVDPETGVLEYGSGPSSDSHAAGFSEADRTPAQRFLKIKGGFLSVLIERVNGHPRAVIQHHGVDGKILNEDVLAIE